jgi:DNA-binding LytR/AlgR family response regulator
MLIKKLGREFLVRVDDIDWIEASGNYVNLHVGSQVYPLRETMTGITERMQPQGFQRVHRSAVVNLDRVAEIVPFESGDGEARLASGARVPVSRRYRKELRERINPAVSG